ncbi:MAG: STAS domain-containing protein [Myxococcaceae bacterium]|nr:STAS domain-containing protein [Myxococcaceae bacterium]
MHLPILRLGRTLIVPLPEALTDSEWQLLRDRILARVGTDRARGVVIDVSAMDVMDSYATRVLDGLARMVELRGATTVVVGVTPQVAFAMSQLGLKLGNASTALDLDEALAVLARLQRRPAHAG